MTLEDDIVRDIRLHGPISFSAFMERALYDPVHGYYASRDARAGWAGDFLTSPQLDPAFGELWARAIVELWGALGRPDDLHVIEVGPGEGGFAVAILDALPAEVAEVLSYRLVERAPQARDRQRALLGGDPRVDWSESLETLPQVDAGVVLANEVLDNLPVDLLEVREGSLHEVRVGARAGELVEVTANEVAAPPGVDPTGLAEGHRIEVRPGTGAFVRAAARSISRGVLVFIDYGYRREEILARPGGTIVCYSRAGADALPLKAPGTKDITAHVDWSAFASDLARAGLDPLGPFAQRDVLRAVGARELDRTLEREHARALAEGRGADAVGSLSRRHALRALLDRGGLGGLDVMFGLKGIHPPRFLESL